MLTLAAIEKARAAIRGDIVSTPLLFSESISKMAGRRVYLKLENLQKTGSFKIRGASYKMLRLGKRVGKKMDYTMPISINQNRNTMP